MSISSVDNSSFLYLLTLNSHFLSFWRSLQNTAAKPIWAEYVSLTASRSADACCCLHFRYCCSFSYQQILIGIEETTAIQLPDLSALLFLFGACYLMEWEVELRFFLVGVEMVSLVYHASLVHSCVLWQKNGIDRSFLCLFLIAFISSLAFQNPTVGKSILYILDQKSTWCCLENMKN